MTFKFGVTLKALTLCYAKIGSNEGQLNINSKQHLNRIKASLVEKLSFHGIPNDLNIHLGAWCM